jgi:hypothetical protein
MTWHVVYRDRFSGKLWLGQSKTKFDVIGLDHCVFVSRDLAECIRVAIKHLQVERGTFAAQCAENIRELKRCARER